MPASVCRIVQIGNRLKAITPLGHTYEKGETAVIGKPESREQSACSSLLSLHRALYIMARPKTLE